MNQKESPGERLMIRWLEMSDTALRDATYAGVSEHTRCSAAFEAGYVCALYLVGPDALKLDDEHPSERVLKKAAEIAGIDVRPGLLHLKRRLVDHTRMPALSATLEWAHSMRALVPSKRLMSPVSSLNDCGVANPHAGCTPLVLGGALVDAADSAWRRGWKR